MANGFFAAALAADSRIAVEPDLRWEGTWASRFALPLARTTHRGARAARRARSDAWHSRGTGDHLGRAAFAAGTDRVANCRRAGPDSTRVARAAPGGEAQRSSPQPSRRRRSSQNETPWPPVRPLRKRQWQRSSQNETPWPVRPLRKRPRALVSPVRQRLQRSPSRPRSTWRRLAGASWSCLPLSRGQM